VLQIETVLVCVRFHSIAQCLTELLWTFTYSILDRRIQGGGSSGGRTPSYIFSDTIFDRWFQTQKRPLVWFFWIVFKQTISCTGILKNIKCIAYIAEFGQSESVYSLKTKRLIGKFLYKKYGLNVT